MPPEQNRPGSARAPSTFLPLLRACFTKIHSGCLKSFLPTSYDVRYFRVSLLRIPARVRWMLPIHQIGTMPGRLVTPGAKVQGRLNFPRARGLTRANRSSFKFDLLLLYPVLERALTVAVVGPHSLSPKKPNRRLCPADSGKNGWGPCAAASRTRFGLQTHPPALFGGRLSYHWETERLTRNDTRRSIRDAFDTIHFHHVTEGSYALNYSN
ncbi:hypothetical protein F5144DRAFT_111860 [Chaetomium tenue]|uniref:Uncharacterized protein n=1 Tax=Chaetomium tenue TaxID=1854479 RepID=A0ACB7PLZ7_9PEZI|nr:hypothetical protein F5144DRAFT_111860 [Chaetomium globosum]